jgi:hypothetical protein
MGEILSGGKDYAGEKYMLQHRHPWDSNLRREDHEVFTPAALTTAPRRRLAHWINWLVTVWCSARESLTHMKTSPLPANLGQCSAFRAFE